MKRLVRHEFVVNADKHPDVAAWIEDPRNTGKIGQTIVNLLEVHIWASKNLHGVSMTELLQGVHFLGKRLTEIASRLPKEEKSG